MQEFGNYIKQLRLSNKLTQTQFAAKINIDSAALSKIENGKKDFDSSKLNLLSSVFKVDLSELKSNYFGEKFAYELIINDCSNDALKIADSKYKYLVSRGSK